MATVNVDKLSLRELRDLEGKVQRAIASARERERNELRQRIESLIEDAGLSVSEVLGSRSTKGRSVPVKYVNPENRTETWTGRGRKPRWLAAKLDKGAKLEDFAVR